MIEPGSREFNLLYTDEYGDLVDLVDVQLMDPPREERVPELSGMVSSSNLYLSYQASLILAAWGNDIGLGKLEEFIDRGDLSAFGLSPHRITGEDNAYDEISYAVHLYGLSGGDMDRVSCLYRKILALYSKHFFQGELKYALFKANDRELELSIEKAIYETYDEGRLYQASQLLPVLAMLNADKGWSISQKFLDFDGLIPDPNANVAEALKFFPRAKGKNLLSSYLKSKAPGVAEAARESELYLNRN